LLTFRSKLKLSRTYQSLFGKLRALANVKTDLSLASQSLNFSDKLSYK